MDINKMEVDWEALNISRGRLLNLSQRAQVLGLQVKLHLIGATRIVI